MTRHTTERNASAIAELNTDGKQETPATKIAIDQGAQNRTSGARPAPGSTTGEQWADGQKSHTLTGSLFQILASVRTDHPKKQQTNGKRNGGASINWKAAQARQQGPVLSTRNRQRRKGRRYTKASKHARVALAVDGDRVAAIVRLRTTLPRAPRPPPPPAPGLPRRPRPSVPNQNLSGIDTIAGSKGQAEYTDLGARQKAGEDFLQI